MTQSKRHADGSLTVGTGTAHPGEIVRCQIPLGQELCGSDSSIPLILVNGAHKGPILWLNGGTHGDEPEGAVAILKLLERIDPSVLHGAIVACPAMNPRAFEISSRGNPLDPFAYDMNRIYPGSAVGQPTERVAAAHWKAMDPACDLQINFHAGGNEMYIAEMLFVPDTPACLEMAAAMGPACSLIVPIPSGDGNPSSKLAESGRAAVGIELGGPVGCLGKGIHEAGERLRDITLNLMRHYGMIGDTPRYAESWSFGHLMPVLSPCSGLWLSQPGLRLLEPTPAGTRIGTMFSLHGEAQCEVVTPCDGTIAGLRTQPQTFAGQHLVFFVASDSVRTDLLTASVPQNASQS